MGIPQLIRPSFNSFILCFFLLSPRPNFAETLINMKFFKPVVTGFLLVSITVYILISCKKDTKQLPSPEDRDGTELPGAITGIGTPVGPAVSIVIGINGGTFTTSDGSLKIEIPAGAFTTDQTITIQPISNLNKAGTGTAYRLTPHAVTFNKPVTLTFSYSDSNLINTTPAAISVSCQDEKGVWQAIGNAVRDTANRTVTVKTTHFSDWSLFQMLRIAPWRSFSEPGGTIDLKVMKMVKTVTPVGGLEMPQPDQPITDTTGAIVTEWSTLGGGFTLGTGSAATYYAPTNLLERNPVVITAHVAAKGNEKWMLTAFVYVGKEGINYRMDNGQWVNAPVILGAIKVNDTLRMLQGVPLINNQQAGAMTISWLGDRSFASQRWTEKYPAFQYAPGGNITYWQFSGEGNNISISPGSLSFMEYENDYVSGSFLLTKAGKLINSVPSPQWQNARFEGFFRVKWKK
ncbi:MAG TPA: hypothetical protein VHN59_11995 [Chitinophagaceae bacterium]|nr:hypothetical protein [Chitinophagaceae bacterium]